MSSLPLSEKVAIVTGGSRSIGAAIAIRLARDGANVIVNYVRNSQAANEVVFSIAQVGKGRAIPVKADLATGAGRQFLIDETVRQFGRIDILVNNAGIMGSRTLEHIDEAFFDDHINLNVKSPLFLTQAAVKHMAPGSRVIFCSSSLSSATTVLPNALVYLGSKGAVEQFTRVLSKDLASKGINVNCVSPGPTDTALFRAGKPESVIKHIAGLSPYNRLGNVDDISGTVAFLVGPDAAWVTGQNIRVNGAFAV
ncbi:NAD-P-binding protein [Gautieria morchelliformis]|nr:NAD-P-binding protein [Gautieria morchelliformis]